MYLTYLKLAFESLACPVLERKMSIELFVAQDVTCSFSVAINKLFK